MVLSLCSSGHCSWRRIDLSPSCWSNIYLFSNMGGLSKCNIMPGATPVSQGYFISSSLTFQTLGVIRKNFPSAYSFNNTSDTVLVDSDPSNHSGLPSPSFHTGCICLPGSPVLLNRVLLIFEGLLRETRAVQEAWKSSGKPGEKHFSPVPLLFAPHDKCSFGSFINRLLKCHLFRSVRGLLERTAGTQADRSGRCLGLSWQFDNKQVICLKSWPGLENVKLPSFMQTKSNFADSLKVKQGVHFHLNECLSVLCVRNMDGTTKDAS